MQPNLVHLLSILEATALFLILQTAFLYLKHGIIAAIYYNIFILFSHTSFINPSEKAHLSHHIE